MPRWFAYLAASVLASAPFASCTCHRDISEPPKRVERETGFSALPGARKPPRRHAPEPPLAVRVTPGVQTLPPAAAVPTAAVATLPDDFPEDVPVLEGTEVMAVQELAGNARNVLFQADAEPAEIFVYYRDEMRGEGWNVTQEYQRNDQSFLSFRKGQMITNVTVARDPRTGKRIVAIMYYEEEELAFPEF